MMALTFQEITQKINSVQFEDTFDLIVAIGRGGIIPGSLLQLKLDIEMKIIWLRFRDEDKTPLYDKPRLLSEFGEVKNRKILLVDDVSKTGQTLDCAKEILNGNFAKTFVLNGKADFALFSFPHCVEWPWNSLRK